MKKQIRILPLLLALLLLASLLTGCGSKSSSFDYASGASTAEVATPQMAPSMAEESKAEMEVSFDTTASNTTAEDVDISPETTVTTAEKIIYSGYIYLETTTFDEALESLEQAIAGFGGFIESSNVQGYTRYDSNGQPKVVNRWANYRVRIPANKFDAFMTKTGSIGNITNTSRSAENVTSQYTDYEARLSSLRIQEERLLAMLEQSGDLESLIQLEARLSEVRYEIERIERNLRNLDQRISYSTVELDIQEVEIYTPTVPVQRTFLEKLSSAFTNGWSGFVSGVQNFIIELVYSLPVLILLAIIIVLIVLVVRRVRKRFKTRKLAKAQRKLEEKQDAQE